MASHPLEKAVGPTWILNGASIHMEAARAHIARISEEFGVQARVVVARSGDKLSPLAASAVDENGQPVVAGGGDGTVNAVAGALVGTNMALGVLPIGTLNHFAKDLGIPLGLEAAVRNIFTGQTIKVDVGEVNGRVFVNNSGIGLYPHIVRQREEQQRHGHVKWVAFVLAVGSVLRRYARLRVRLHMDEAEALARVTPFVFVGNNRYEIAGLEIGRRTSLDSGRLWVCMPHRTGRRNLVGMALRALMGRVSDDELNAFEVEEIWVQAGTKWVNVSTDGEVTVMDAPLHYRIRPHSLRVVVPSQAIG
jgi:diacylglycerol kinase family enzyme